MKQSNNRGSVAMLFSLLIAIFIVFGVNKAFADPQPLPFHFSPGIGALVWEGINYTAPH